MVIHHVYFEIQPGGSLGAALADGIFLGLYILVSAWCIDRLLLTFRVFRVFRGQPPMNSITPLRLEANALIEQLDDVIATVRVLWLQSPRNSQQCHRWMWRLNQLLDQRLHLMRLRDQ